MINKALVEENGNRRMEPEMRDVYDELRQRDFPVELFIKKRLDRRQLSLTKDTLVVGYVDTFLAALRQLDIAAPANNDYPSALQPFFHRRIWQSTVREVSEWVYNANGPIFAKPKERKKRFTGHVFQYPDDLGSFLEGTSGATPVWCSEVLEWLSEYRVYVIRGQIVGIGHYAGNPTIKLDEQVVREAVRILEASPERTAGYGVDFGVTASGHTALVEWNDGYSLGSYELDKTIYTDLLIARWCELADC
jgi:hypothetical protein